jgi:hypothetical protein
MTKQTLRIFILLFLPFIGYGQTQIRCAIKEVAQQSLRNRHQAFEKKLQQYYSKAEGRLESDDRLIKIPVVVHVVHNNASGAIGGDKNNNISDDQIISQIKVLNEDYRRKSGSPGFNSSSVGADMNIEFVLASVDPEGNPSNGITRTYSAQASFDVFKDNYTLSSLSYWDANKYLNIWVTTIKDGYLGYGEFPGADFDGLELEDVNEQIDGVIIDHKAFGRQTGTSNSGVYKFGRTVTHEVGHWLGLIHTWGDAFCGDDFCNDTPPTERANLSNFCRPLSSNCNGIVTQNMIENFMDYTPDSCMNTFTQDQKGRVRAVLELSKRRRRLVINSQFSLPAAEKFEVRVLENPTVEDQFRLQVLLPGYKDFSYKVYNSMGQEVLAKDFKDYPSTVIEIPRTKLSKGIFNIRLISGGEVISKRLISL